ncbi:MAG: hypothetical protein NUV34_07680, partial [Sulfuricaulis sp.]|nr:hypothetical protein [Sulfuricaulis sp.]
LGGAGAAARLGTLGRAGRVASKFIEPISKGGTAQKIAAEAALSASGRAGAETLNRGLDKLGVESTPVRIAASIAGGLVGGVAGMRAIEGATRGALGSDLLALAPQPIRVKTTTPEAGQRVGKLLNARTIDQLGPDATAKKILREGADLAMKKDSTVNSLAEQVSNSINRLGKRIKGQDGNWYVRDANGVPQMLQDVIDRPSRYHLTPEQIKAQAEIVAYPTIVFNEGDVFNVAPGIANLEMGQSFFPRLAIDNPSGTARPRQRGSGGGLTRGRPTPGRKYADALEAAADGVVYADPVVAFSHYTDEILTRAINNHVADMALKLGVDPRADASYQAFKKHVANLTATTRSARATLIRQRTRASTLGDVADATVRGTERGAERTAKSAERLAQRQAAVTWQDIVEVRDHTSGLITEGRDLARRIQSNIDTLRPIKGALRENDRALLKQVDNLSRQMNDAENANQLVSQIERTIQQPAQNPTDSIYRQAQREYTSTDRRAGII